MPIDNQPQIFLSYSWANKDIAEEIDNAFKSVGITFQIDVRDVKYTGSIKDFMHKIGKSDFVVMLISDEYIKSENCMYEVNELLNSHEFEKRILPVILNKTNVFSRTEHEGYYDYWLDKLENVKRLFSKHSDAHTLAEKKKIQNIYDNIGLFFQKITELKLEKYEELKAKNYKLMLGKIGFDDNNLIEKIMKTSEIKDEEEQEIAIEEILKIYPDNKHVLFQRAFNANQNKKYKKAKKYYEEFIIKYPFLANAHFNLGRLLEDNFSDYHNAREHYKMAIKITPNFSEGHNIEYSGAK